MTKMKIQDGIVIGNVEDKTSLNNPISRWLVNGFDRSLFNLIKQSEPKSLHEVGCGEGRLTTAVSSKYSIPVRGSDFGKSLIDKNKANEPNSSVQYVNKSIYDLDVVEDSADLIVCCEVLEHLECPEKALEALRNLDARHYIFSVPREPLWCLFNMVRGKYWKSFGNTPGHLNNWSQRAFLSLLVNAGFSIKCLCTPVPWTMVLCSIEDKDS
jgi:SAM-dependent methyltransferase